MDEQEVNGRLNAIGDIRGLYLWDAVPQLRFLVSSGSFGLMVAIAVTEDEIYLGHETTPPHVLLLLKRMRIGQIRTRCAESVLTLPGADAEWAEIRSMSHDSVIRHLTD